MRYIDADKLQEEFKELHGGKRSLLIDTQPTADVRENVRGEWIRRKDKPLQNWYQCSICGAICGDAPRYCSECGAQMRTANSKGVQNEKSNTIDIGNGFSITANASQRVQRVENTLHNTDGQLARAVNGKGEDGLQGQGEHKG